MLCTINTFAGDQKFYIKKVVVTLLDNTTDTVYSDIFNDKQYSFLLEPENTVFAFQTKSITACLSDGSTREGITVDSMWLFQMSDQEGPIQYFSRYPEMFKPAKFYFHKQGLGYLPYGRKNLKKIVEDDDLALKKVKQYFFWRSVKNTTLGISFGYSAVTLVTVPPASIPGVVLLGTLPSVGNSELGLLRSIADYNNRYTSE